MKGMKELEWIPVNLPYGRLYDDDFNPIPSVQDSPDLDKIMRAGNLLRVFSDGKWQRFLVGHINQSGGVCDDCREFSRDAVVDSYAIVWSEE